MSENNVTLQRVQTYLRQLEAIEDEQSEKLVSYAKKREELERDIARLNEERKRVENTTLAITRTKEWIYDIIALAEQGVDISFISGQFHSLPGYDETPALPPPNKDSATKTIPTWFDIAIAGVKAVRGGKRSHNYGSLASMMQGAFGPSWETIQFWPEDLSAPVLLVKDVERPDGHIYREVMRLYQLAEDMALGKARPNQAEEQLIPLEITSNWESAFQLVKSNLERDNQLKKGNK
jgi:hypothetical protein